MYGTPARTKSPGLSVDSRSRCKHCSPRRFLWEDLVARPDPSVCEMAIWVVSAYRPRRRRGEPADSIEYDTEQNGEEIEREKDSSLKD